MRISQIYRALISSDQALPAPDSPAGAELRRQQILILVRQTPVLMVAVLVNAVALVLAETDEPLLLRLFWLLLIAGVATNRLVAWWQNRNRPPPAYVRAAAVTRAIRLALLMGAVWGSASLIFFDDYGEGSITVLMACMAGTSAGGAVALGPVPWAALAFNAGVLLPLIIRLLLSSAFEHVMLGVMVIMYVGVLLFATRTVFSIFVSNVLARFELAQVTAIRGMLQEVAAAANQAATLAGALPACLASVKAFIGAERAVAILRPMEDGGGELVSPADESVGASSLTEGQMEAVGAACRSGSVIERNSSPGHARLVAAPVTLGPETVAVIVLALPPKGDHAVLDAVLAQLRRVAERERIEATLVEAKRNAEAASQAKSRFLATMSHEIRTPLNGVLGTLELLTSTELTEEQAGMADTIRHSGEHLRDIISDVLDLSKIEADGLQLGSVPFDPAAAVIQAASPFRSIAVSKGIAFNTAVAEGVPAHVEGDPMRFRQVVANLVSNAVKFTSGGTVDIVVETRRSEGQDVVLRCTVRDTGIGIPEKQRATIFDAFVQADQSTTREYRGTGLGLTISRRLVALMGGSIDFDSVVGRGTTVWFDLPFRRAAAPAEADARAAAPPRGAVHVLVAEDDPVNAQVAMAMLKRLGCRARLVHDGIAAIDAWRSGTFDVILMDCQMPIMDGFAATRAIRAEEQRDGRPPISIVAVTANAVAGDREACIAVGMDRYLAKPFRLADLEAVLFRAATSKSTTEPVPLGSAAT